VCEVVTRFTKISKHRCGPPRYGRGPLDEPVNGPVVEYRMSPEEVARRYGPPPAKESGKRRQRLNRELLMKKLRKQTVGQVAADCGCPQNLIFKMVERYGIELDEKNRLKKPKEAESVNADIGHQAQGTVNPEEPKEGFQTYPVGDAGSEEPKKSRVELAREKLSPGEYKRRRANGETNKQIMRDLGIPNDVFYWLKKEWAGAGGKNEPVQQEESGPEQAQEPAPGPAPAEDTRPGPLAEDVRPDPSVEVCRLNILLEKMDRRLDATVRLLNDLADRYEDLEQEYRRHRHQVGPGHWSGKEEN
jgi:hypothetical protein